MPVPVALTWHCIGAPGFGAVLPANRLLSMVSVGEPKITAANPVAPLPAKVQFAMLPPPPKQGGGLSALVFYLILGLLLSGTKLRQALYEGADIPAEFSRPEVLEVLRAYYAGLAEDEKVEVKLSGHSGR